jgi:uncharacterized protein YeaO (DUF488 family)
MPIKLKSILEPTEPSDGLRILITRKPPPKYTGKVIMELSPSEDLLYDFKYRGLSWTEYKRRFIAEMKNNPEAMELIRWLSNFERNDNSQTVTLICFCPNENQCHRSLVKNMALECLSLAADDKVRT